VNQLDQVANGTHDHETHTNSLAEPQELLLIGLGAPAHELNAILSELGGNLQKLLNLVRHVDCVLWQKGGRR
jgi:hypothetical protein